MEPTPTRFAPLLSAYEVTIDDKNRMLIPSEVRKNLVPERDGDAFYMVIGSNQHLWFYPTLYYESLVAQIPSELIPEDDLLAFDQLHFALASRVGWDKQGRILIPEKTLRQAGLDKEVTLIGVRDHLELWNRPEWEARSDELQRARSDILSRARKASGARGTV